MNGADQVLHEVAVVVTLLLAIIGAIAVAMNCRKLRGTTLVGSQVWLGACLVVGATIEVWQALAAERSGASPVESLRYLVAVLTFCPLMALMGAKRPQDRPWHFIVLSLWVVLALPAMHGLLLRWGQTFSMPSALAWFMLGLITIGFFNRLLTPAWPSGLLFACGQTSLLATQMPFLRNVPGIDGYQCHLIGLGMIAMSAIYSWWLSHQRRPAIEPLDRLWLEFRDLFGVLWALRLAERVNSAAVLTNSDIELRWSGFRTSAGGRITESLSPEAIRILRQGLENLLRRFVSRAWIAERLQESNKLIGAEDETR